MLPVPARRSLVGPLLSCALTFAVAPARADTALGERLSWSGKIDSFATGAAMAARGPSGTKSYVQPAAAVIAPSQLPADAEPVAVLLYWAGSVNNSGCTGATWDDDVVLNVPGMTGAGVHVPADECFCASGSSYYEVQSCRADITQLVRDNASGLSGSWSVSRFAARISPSSSVSGASTAENASFSLVIVYRSAGLKPRRVVLYDGLQTLYQSNVSLTLAGLRVDDPPEGDLTTYALDGDAGATGDSVTVQGIPGNRSLSLSDVDNPVDDVMNGTINTVSPVLKDLMGVDIDRFDIGRALTPDDAELRIRCASLNDKFWLAYELVGINVYEAVLAEHSSLAWSLWNDADRNGVPSPGDTVRYEARFVNSGSGAGSVQVTDDVPAAAASWSSASIAGATDVSTPNRFILSDLAIAPGATAAVSFDMVVADVPDRTTVSNAMRYDARPRGDTGTLDAPSLIVRRDGDGDGIFDSEDNCPAAANADQLDGDGDGIGDACDTCPDDDHDGVCRADDNCPAIANPGQEDGDTDGVGDACDACENDPLNDADGDGVCESLDDCPGVADPQQVDTDRDGSGDACDPCPADSANDADGDRICGDVDVCPSVFDPEQLDADEDGRGDACDSCPADARNDFDGDGLCGEVDDCPTQYDPDQADRDGDGVGDACDRCPEDPKNVLDDMNRCENERLGFVKDTGGCGCGSVLPGAEPLLLALLVRRRRKRREVL